MIKNRIPIKRCLKNGCRFASFGRAHSMLKIIIHFTSINFNSIKSFLFFILLFQCVLLSAQSPTVVLPTDGGSTQSSAPQGGFRYQRGFYLIQPKEMKASGLVMNDTINCIGFTIGAAQSDTTKGAFKVYLQNTTDSVSRGDTAWVVVPNIMTNYYQANNLFPGNYEWQIRSNCSPFSPIRNFTNLDLGSCQPPTHLVTTAITPTGATFNWVAPATPVVKYYIEYKKSDVVNWTRDSTLATSFVVSTLVPNSAYQWRVKSSCAVDSSDFDYLEFNTPQIDVCVDPLAGSMMVTAVTDTLVKLKWTGVGADYYTVRWKRLGTISWTTTLAFVDSITINYGLFAGTTYEWQIRSNCGSDSVGAFAQGPNFTTTGPPACYFPEYFSLDSITGSSVKFTWETAGTGAISYDLRYRAKDIISWASAISPMVLVHHDSICIPDNIGPYYVPFEGGMDIDTFVYSGEGVYVAWEYKDSLGMLSSLNSSLTTTAHTSLKGSMGQDSITYTLSFITPGDSSAIGPDSILNATKYRPETRLCSPSLHDSVEVVTVYALGKNAPLYTSYPISAVIRNYAAFPGNYTVNLTVKNAMTNALRYSESKIVAIGADTIGLVEFTGWSPPATLETDSIIVSINGLPGENVLNNNRNFYIQMITPNIVSYADGSEKITQAGTDTAAGLTLSRHLMEGCGKINGVEVFLTRSAIGNSVYAIALDTNGTIIAQSFPFIPDSTQIDQYHTFYFSDTMRLLINEKYYVGLAQTANPVGYFPVGVQYESQYIRDSAYFRGRINGDSIWHQPYPGRLMIRAILVPGVATPSITGDFFLCNSTTDTLVASSVVARYADSVIAYSSQIGTTQYGAQEALGTPNVFPEYGPHPAAWLSATDAGREFLVLGFSNPDSINFVDVFETYNPGALDSVYLRDEGTGLFNLVWTGTASPAPQTSRKHRIKFPLTTYKVSGVRLAFNMAAVPGFSAVDAVCIGRLTTPGVFSSISWTGGSTNDTLLITIPGGYKLTTVDAMGCMGMDSVTVITPVQVTPVITVVGSTTICPGDSVLLKSSLSGNNIWSTGSTADSIYVKLASSYTVMHDDGSGCGITMSLPVMITVYTPPVVNITGDTVICPNDFNTLHATPGFVTYLWSTGAVSDSINVFIPGQYAVTVTDGNGCKGSDTVVTTAGVYPVAAISGALLFCPGDSTTLDAGPGFSSYLWSTGATSDTIIVTTAGNFSVTVTNVDGCESSTNATTSLHNSPFAIISGNDGFCPMDSVQLNASGGISYLWSTGSMAQTIQVNMAGNYILTVTDGNGCKDSVSKNIIQFVPPTPFIAGTLSFCGGGSVTTLSAGLGYSSYLWSTGETSSSILVSMVGSYSVTVTDNNGCEGSASATVTQEGGIPEVPGPITGDTIAMCNINTPSIYFISPIPNSDCYFWKVPAGATIVSPDSMGTQIAVVFDNSFTGGYIEVSSHNACGNSPTFNGRRLYVSAFPGSVPGSISGQRSGVCKQLAAVYSIPNILGATSYLWSVPLGAMIISGQGTPSIVVSFASSYRIGDICVQYSTLCGTSPFECISVDPRPVTGNAITGPAVVCASTINTAYSIPLSNGANNYHWTVPTGATIVSGQGSNNIQVNFGNFSGLISVRASNDCGDGLFQFLLVNITPCNKVPRVPDLTTRKKQTGFRVSIFPNPSGGILNLDLQTQVNVADENYTLSVYDPLNQLLYSSKISSASELRQTLDLRHFTKGIYFLQVRSKSQSYTTKVLLH